MIKGAVAVETSVFDAFKNAIIKNVWQFGICKRGTVVGNQFKPLGFADVIIDDTQSAGINATPENITTDMLVYIRPEHAFGCDLENGGVASRLVGDYMLYNTKNDSYFLIKTVGVGKNQHTGKIEHIELGLVATEIADV